MKNSIEIETERPQDLKDILAPSLDSDGKVRYQITANGKKLEIRTETEGFGTLRGATDNAFRLASLALKLY